MATIKDVAKEADVAISTVSNVLNKVDVVKPETREKVLAAVKKLNYTPNLNGRFLKKAETKVLGLFITNLEGPFYNDLISAMYAQCCKNNYSLTVFLNNEKNVLDSYYAILGKRVDGAIILNNTIKESHVEMFQKMGMPIIFLDREVTGKSIASVVIDNYDGMKQAVEYLLRAGHTKIGYVHGQRGNYDEIMRYRGYLDTLKAHDIAVAEEYEMEGHFSQLDTYKAVCNYVKSGKMLPQAFLCANDQMAIGCIEALVNNGVEVPKDISVVGFDNIEKTNYYTPKITTVDSAIKELGKAAVDKLLAILNQQSFEKVSLVTTHLMLRDSCEMRK